MNWFDFFIYLVQKYSYNDGSNLFFKSINVIVRPNGVNHVCINEIESNLVFNKIYKNFTTNMGSVNDTTNDILSIVIDGYNRDIKFRELAKIYPTYNKDLFYYLNRTYKDAFLKEFRDDESIDIYNSDTDYADVGLHNVNINSLYDRLAYINYDIIADTKYDCIGNNFWIIKSEHVSTDEFFKNILILVLESPFDYIDINPHKKFGVEMADQYEKFGIRVCVSYPNLLNDFINIFMPKPKKVYFKNPYTIVIWEDDTKTIVKCKSGDEYNKLTGYLLCYFKRINGNDSSAKYQKMLKEIGAYE